MTIPKPDQAPKFAIFRARDASTYEETGAMTSSPLTPIEQEGSVKTVEAGILEGSTIRLLFSAPGFSLTYAWFKSGFPLPRHSHDADCLYYVVAGTLKIGTEVLGKGDGFFVGSDVPYTYVPGEEGVEVLEFRTSNQFGIKLLANNPAFWDNALASLAAQKAAWGEQLAPPSGTPLSS